jgi:quercetin dioxygenase-like cupin family protein
MTTPAAEPEPESTAAFEAFSAASLARGFDEVLVREWLPDQRVGEHTHPFDVDARVVRGNVLLSCGNESRHIRAGEGFQLARDTPHTEQYGPEGATFWVARRNTPR